MIIQHISNLEAVGLVLGLVLFAWLFLRLVPGRDKPQVEIFTPAEGKVYDRELPKYFLIASVALVAGGLHMVVKNVPPFWQWLWQADYGGHLFRDAANSHIVIMGGGTILLMGLTWYVLPRFTNRPLASTKVAGASLWLTVIGVWGCYLSWAILGLVEGNMVHHGWTYEAAKDYLNYWHKLPVGLSSGIMAIGYWLYILNVLLTVSLSRRVQQRPWSYLSKYLVVSSIGFLVGTLQGVIQVMPDNADWIEQAGKFGEYAGAISQSHVNLVVGMIVALAALLLYFGPRMQGLLVLKRDADRLFGLLVAGAVGFYLVLVYSGLILGRAATGYGGADIPWLEPLFLRGGPWVVIGGAALLAIGLGAYLFAIGRTLDLGNIYRELLDASPQAFWLVSGLVLVLGCLHGIAQAFPGLAQVITAAEELANVHGQLNMVGGIILPLMGTVYLLLPDLVGQSIPHRLRQASLVGVTGGILTYYLATWWVGWERLAFVRQGLGDAGAAAQLGSLEPSLLLLASLLLWAGYGAFGVGVWQATAVYRRGWSEQLRQLARRFDGPIPRWQHRTPIGYLILAEALLTLLGFPGIGWMVSGQAFVGMILVTAGPIMLWVIIPTLMSLTDTHTVSLLPPLPMLVYLIATTLLSPTLLGMSLVRRRRARDIS